FMPWLVGTALIHSLAVTEKRGGFKSWTVLLAITAFSLSLLGTFLVRSGVLTSVHAFATDPKRGIFILGFLTLVIGGSLALYAWRAKQVGLGSKFDLLSRESLLLTNNVLLIVAAGSVLLGTLYPLFVDALNLGKLSVGPPYFNTVFVPLMAPAAFLIGVGPIARWKQAKIPELAVRLRWAFALSFLMALLLPFVIGGWKWRVSLGLLLSFWIVVTVAQNFWRRLRPVDGSSFFTKLRTTSRSYYGMQLAHLGVAVFIAGVTVVTSYQTEKDVKMNIGDTVNVGGYDFQLRNLAQLPGPNYQAVRADIEVTKNGAPVAMMHPEKRAFTTAQSVTSETAIDRSVFRDLYVALGDQVDNRAWTVRVYHKPLVNWIWGGALMMAIGGAFAVSDRRYALTARKEAQETAASNPEQVATVATTAASSTAE
ncbi:MAG TPA: cytochrome c-type biogenesis CcmF C-terminal domain-containing protein, partial [Pyrinomonadaceae bacterium]|nr:cytochrome c-type biogenesis CcmF C-terminal domain-containing protein [Pyrinomonadaceae bacterium]